MRLYPVAVLAGLLPLVCIHITYLLAASHGQVSWCFPYIDSCTSISATGREPPAYFVFKGMMIPTAVLLTIYWAINAQWLKQMGCTRARWLRTLIIIGLLSGIGLIFYAVLLGSIGPQYRLIRHTGVLAFFGFSFLAQLLITWLLQSAKPLSPLSPFLLRTLLLIVLLDLLVGVANVVIGFMSPVYYDTVNNAFAWNFTSLLCLHVLTTALLWRKSDLRFSLVFEPGG